MHLRILLPRLIGYEQLHRYLSLLRPLFSYKNVQTWQPALRSVELQSPLQFAVESVMVG